ncbi:MAG: DciA family protein [Deltaproteobacteria bacterium]|jgi:hypothetical protein|nr:DciA family protein [Deltaproteobacteria bacterium]
MRKKNHVTSITRSVSKLLNQNERVREMFWLVRAQSIWQDIPGNIGKGTWPLELEKQVLTVIALNSSWLQEAQYFRSEIKTHLRSTIRGIKLKKINFIPADENSLPQVRQQRQASKKKLKEAKPEYGSPAYNKYREVIEISKEINKPWADFLAKMAKDKTEEPPEST